MRQPSNIIPRDIRNLGRTDTFRERSTDAAEGDIEISAGQRDTGLREVKFVAFSAQRYCWIKERIYGCRGEYTHETLHARLTLANSARLTILRRSPGNKAAVSVARFDNETSGARTALFRRLDSMACRSDSPGAYKRIHRNISQNSRIIKASLDLSNRSTSKSTSCLKHASNAFAAPLVSVIVPHTTTG